MILMTKQYTRLCCVMRTHLLQPRQRMTQCSQTHTKLPFCINSDLIKNHSAAPMHYSQQKGLSFCQRRHYSSESSLLCCPLSNRILVKMKGRDSQDFLQGLITNDVQLLSKEQPSIYTMMLNVQGRVLYDMIIYVLPPEDEQSIYLIECDKELAAELIQTMNKYKIRKKITMTLAGDQYKVWAVLPSDVIKKDKILSLNLNEEKDVVISVPDPRLPQFGHRIITKEDQSVSDFLINNHVICDDRTYDKRRYIVGLSEGPTDLPPGNCTPLESNAVFLNGVSFVKGCYIGQELTARTHHTGVIRKRLMPIIIHGDSTQLKPGLAIENDQSKNCGKYRNSIESNGLALLRLQEAIGKDTLVVKNETGVKLANIEASFPWWWPTDSDEVIKQILTTVKS